MKLSVGIFQPRSRRNFWTRMVLLWLAACLGGMPLLALAVSPGIASEKKAEGGSGKASWLGPTIKMSPLVVNLNEPSGRHYLKTTIILELGRTEWIDEVQQQIACLTDLMITTLGDKKLADMKKPQSKEAIRKELLAKAQSTPVGNMIKQIYFFEFLFQ